MWISLITGIIGLLFLAASVAGLWVDAMDKGVIEDFTTWLDRGEEDWNWIVFFAAVAAVLFGGGYFIDFMKKKAKFNKLIDISSKRAFLENQDDIEILAYKLGTSFEARVDEKVAELKIKR